MDIEPEEVEDGEELYELLPNGETSDVSSEAEENSEMPYYTGSNASSCHTENTQNPQRSIIEDIRSVPITSSSLFSVILSSADVNGLFTCLFSRTERVHLVLV